MSAQMKSYKRWALQVRYPGEEPFLVGRYAWFDGTQGEIPTRTFRTRADALEAKAALRSFRKRARVVRVTVDIYPLHVG